MENTQWPLASFFTVSQNAKNVMWIWNRVSTFCFHGVKLFWNCESHSYNQGHLTVESHFHAEWETNTRNVDHFNLKVSQTKAIYEYGCCKFYEFACWNTRGTLYICITIILILQQTAVTIWTNNKGVKFPNKMANRKFKSQTTFTLTSCPCMAVKFISRLHIKQIFRYPSIKKRCFKIVFRF